MERRLEEWNRNWPAATDNMVKKMSQKAMVLIINDRHSEVWYIGETLQKEGYDICTAFDGREGLQKIQDEKPDLIILDAIMPKMDGYEVFHSMQKEPVTASIPVLFLSSKREEDERVTFYPKIRKLAGRRNKMAEGRQEAIVGFLTKPVAAEEVVKRVQSLLQSRQLTTNCPEVRDIRTRVLVIDDDRSLVGFTEQALHKKGYDVLTAFDGLEGLRRAQEEKPDLILLDTIIPELSSLQVLSFLRQKSKVPVTMLTERSELALLKKAMALGANNYIIKPFSTSDLLARVRGKTNQASEGK